MVRIESAAIRVEDVIWTVPPPGRHYHIFTLFLNYHPGLVTVPPHKQGFITDAGDFVDRKEAMKIAEKAGQVVRKTGPKDTLFTEDMW